MPFPRLISKKNFLIFPILFLFIYLLSDQNTLYRLYYVLQPKAGISCYRFKTGATLPQISDIHPEIGKKKSIFFHETSCASFYNGKITISGRQACAVESAAKLNPNSQIFVLYASPGVFKFEENTISDKLLQALLIYPNVKILHVDYEEYTKNTPLEQIFRDGQLEASEYAHSHASDIFRYDIKHDLTVLRGYVTGI